MRAYSKFFILSVAFVILIHFLSVGVGPVPGLGALLSFSQGVYVNARENPFGKKELKSTFLKDKVEIFYDQNKVPHVFAKNFEDLYFAQGYLMAQFRLWQMDILTRVGGGQLSEILGKRTANVDRFFIQAGLRKASRESLDQILSQEKSRVAVTSFTQGINAYILSLNYEDWPVEYKVVQFRPAPFSEIRVAQFLKMMSFNLAARSYDLKLTEIFQKLGWEQTSELFPDFYGPLIEEPGFDVLFHDLNGQTSNQKSKDYKVFKTHFENFPEFLKPFETDGSNSWVVSKERTRAGFNILANDTHLGLQSPSVWVEMRLNVPGQLDVYGASFPASPGVILGMNSHFAWGSTNGTVDVVDWFELEFENETSNRYLVDGKWIEAQVEEESLKVRKRKEEKVSVVWTQFGPVVHREGRRGLAFRWTAHEPSNELEIFLKLDQAQSVAEAKVLLRDYVTPVQNFSLVDRDHIAIVTAGLVPQKKYGFGRVVEDGTQSQNNWPRLMRINDLLTSENPSNGFLFSANQRPVGSEFQTYLGWDFEQPYRGLRIQHLLGQNSSVEVDDMLKMQNEAFNEWAFHFFKIVDRSQVLGMIHNSFAKQKFEKLLRWDFQDRPEALETSLFSAWFESVSDRLWADPFKFQKKKYYPKVSRSLIEIQKQIREDKESAYKMLAQDFEEGIKNLEKSYGSEEHWTWGEIHPTHFPHVTRFPGFGAATVRPQGSRYSLNSNKGTHGGAWRFVVNFSTPLKAWSQIPGGLNGNPVLPWYVDQIPEWTRGGFKEVQFQPQKETQKNSLESFVMEPL